MNEYNEKIPEYPVVTEWSGVRIRVEISLPWEKHTKTSQMIISREEIQQLEYLKRPEELEILLETRSDIAMLRLFEWEQKNKQAQRVVEIISDMVANHITDSFTKENHVGGVEMTEIKNPIFFPTAEERLKEIAEYHGDHTAEDLEEIANFIPKLREVAMACLTYFENELADDPEDVMSKMRATRLRDALSSEPKF